MAGLVEMSEYSTFDKCVNFYAVMEPGLLAGLKRVHQQEAYRLATIGVVANAGVASSAVLQPSRLCATFTLDAVWCGCTCSSSNG